MAPLYETSIVTLAFGLRPVIGSISWEVPGLRIKNQGDHVGCAATAGAMVSAASIHEGSADASSSPGTAFCVNKLGYFMKFLWIFLNTCHCGPRFRTCSRRCYLCRGSPTAWISCFRLVDHMRGHPTCKYNLLYFRQAPSLRNYRSAVPMPLLPAWKYTRVPES